MGGAGSIISSRSILFVSPVCQLQYKDNPSLFAVNMTSVGYRNSVGCSSDGCYVYVVAVMVVICRLQY